MHLLFLFLLVRVAVRHARYPKIKFVLVCAQFLLHLLYSKQDNDDQTHIAFTRRAGVGSISRVWPTHCAACSESLDWLRHDSKVECRQRARR